MTPKSLLGANTSESIIIIEVHVNYNYQKKFPESLKLKTFFKLYNFGNFVPRTMSQQKIREQEDNNIR